MDLKITYSLGGRKEFEETGVYPEYITFFSEKHNGKWECRYKGMPNKGSLYINGKTIFNYIFHGSYFEIQEVNEDVKLSNWIEIEVVKVLCD